MIRFGNNTPNSIQRNKPRKLKLPELVASYIAGSGNEDGLIVAETTEKAEELEGFLSTAITAKIYDRLH